MARYRCFLMTSDSGLLDSDVAEHRDDQAATAWASELLARFPAAAVEVWDRQRLVCRWDRAGPVATPASAS
jgi:hypothetical protein